MDPPGHPRGAVVSASDDILAVLMDAMECATDDATMAALRADLGWDFEDTPDLVWVLDPNLSLRMLADRLANALGVQP